VAEGVETEAEAAILHREGIGYMQGYYYGRPSLDRPWLQSPSNGAAQIGHEDIFAGKRAANAG
jgi:EAL domain-containing protein (putative c-di-GMP-specific phosphodiesterase class I)